MYTYVNLFLKSEITCIPRLLSKYIGSYYNNTLCNADTWMFVIWCGLHAIYNTFLNAFLRKLRFKQYLRDRMLSSLWYLGFFVTSLAYCGATLKQNDVELFNFKKMSVPTFQTHLPSQLLGYTLISTFYFHSGVWEGVQNNSPIAMAGFVLLGLFMAFSYILRIVEISFTLSALVSSARIALELVRLCEVFAKRENATHKYMSYALWGISLTFFIVVYLFIIPLTFVAPMGLQILTDYPNTTFLLLYFTLTLWLVIEVYNSVLFKAVYHWLYHTKDEKNVHCSGRIVDCSVFAPRDDASFNLNLLRKEMKTREAQVKSMWKPKNRSMLVQTLKCMVALKKKLSEKRLNQESSDSDESDKSEECEKRSPEKESDEEESESEAEEECKPVDAVPNE